MAFEKQLIFGVTLFVALVFVGSEGASVPLQPRARTNFDVKVAEGHFTMTERVVVDMESNSVHIRAPALRPEDQSAPIVFLDYNERTILQVSPVKKHCYLMPFFFGLPNTAESWVDIEETLINGGVQGEMRSETTTFSVINRNMDKTLLPPKMRELCTEDFELLHVAPVDQMDQEEMDNVEEKTSVYLPNVGGRQKRWIFETISIIVSVSGWIFG